MITDIISEDEFRRRVALWLLQNDRSVILPSGMTEEEFTGSFQLPEPEFVHTQSAADASGSINTMLRADIVLKDWQTKDGRTEKHLSLYKVMKTAPDDPEGEPECAGYIIAY